MPQGGRTSQDRSTQMRGQQPSQRGLPPVTTGSAPGAAFSDSRPIEIKSLSKDLGLISHPHRSRKIGADDPQKNVAEEVDPLIVAGASMMSFAYCIFV